MARYGGGGEPVVKQKVQENVLTQARKRGEPDGDEGTDRPTRRPPMDRGMESMPMPGRTGRPFSPGWRFRAELDGMKPWQFRQMQREDNMRSMPMPSGLGGGFGGVPPEILDAARAELMTRTFQDRGGGPFPTFAPMDRPAGPPPSGPIFGGGGRPMENGGGAGPGGPISTTFPAPFPGGGPAGGGPIGAPAGPTPFPRPQGPVMSSGGPTPYNGPRPGMATNSYGNPNQVGLDNPPEAQAFQRFMASRGGR